MDKKKKINLGGAPNLYKKKYCQEMIDYFLTHVEANKSGIPEFLEFALKIGVTARTLRNWKDAHEEFREAYAFCNEIQEWYLENTGLSGKNNPRMTQFLLSVKHKHSEYARRKPNEERAETGLSDGDRQLLTRIEERFLSGGNTERPKFDEATAFGEFPYEDEEAVDGDGDKR